MKKELKNIHISIKNKKKVPEVKLIAVTKNQTDLDVQKLIDLGITDIGENRVQALLERVERFPQLNYHFIGRLQTNKVKVLLPHVTLIHSVASLKLIEVIQLQAEKQKLFVSILLQISPSLEQSKQGFDEATLKEALLFVKRCPNIQVEGFMCMAMNTEDQTLIKHTFTTAKEWYDRYNDHFKYLSMGMSQDYEIALDCGSSMLRIGSLLFNED